ncbi:hypothetical protein SESBI_21014 [Sesbania bispinosa]|nr:hypothetical protein SESBI_21014 [Sesbania bispinosa]
MAAYNNSQPSYNSRLGVTPAKTITSLWQEQESKRHDRAGKEAEQSKTEGAGALGEGAMEEGEEGEAKETVEGENWKTTGNETMSDFQYQSAEKKDCTTTHVAKLTVRGNHKLTKGAIKSKCHNKESRNLTRHRM